MPQVLIVFRDGASMQQMKDNEIPQVEGLAREVIYVMVEKRNHTRFFAQVNNEFFNPEQGGIIESGITTAKPDDKHIDFYLLPTACNLSTMRPVHYTVLHSNSSLPLVQLQQLAYTLSHLYPNWVLGSIKVPFVIQCASKLAGLVGELSSSIHLNDSLKGSYWYL
eukprot:TRINITY_DN6133_c0_g1_i1.p1 TRINITY_DN6133_c0_g1~~TRINITY_DN6133_c0_g1_i1.p1  ORF type:complete len:165 (-),score=32.60 TRINITY_DN6133_c0_g1_i1:210-704(-)